MTKASRMISLKKRAEFLAVAANGKKWVAPFFILQIAPRVAPEGGEASCGVGFTASKKMIGIAVKRNRAKRRLRALAREFLIPHAQSGHNFVMIAREASLSCDMKDMRQHVEKALKRFGLWQEAAS